MSLFMLAQYLFGSGVLLVDDAFHLFVNQLGSLLAVGALETVLIVVIVAEVGQLVAHAQVGDHTKGLLGHPLQVIHRTG